MSLDGVLSDTDNSYNFDISRLSPVNMMKELNLFEKVDRFLNQWGAWVSLAVLMLEASKLLMTIILVFIPPTSLSHSTMII